MIEIVDYRASWPDEFQAIARALRSALGILEHPMRDPAKHDGASL